MVYYLYLGEGKLADRANTLGESIQQGIETNGIIDIKSQDETLSGPGSIYAYEVDGYGNSYFMDDANTPTLLSLPYLGYVSKTDPTYVATRARMYLSSY